MAEIILRRQWRTFAKRCGAAGERTKAHAAENFKKSEEKQILFIKGMKAAAGL